MLWLNGNDIYIPQGDTGKLKITVHSKDSEYVPGANDRVLFTVKKNKVPAIIRVMTPVDGVVVLEFTNAMTKNLAEGSYSYDIRFIRDAVLDDQGLPIDGYGVETPKRIARFIIVETEGDV